MIVNPVPVSYNSLSIPVKRYLGSGAFLSTGTDIILLMIFAKPESKER